jgi:hypothetical protein
LIGLSTVISRRKEGNGDGIEELKEQRTRDIETEML